MQIERQQEVQDWLDHPITRNFFTTVQEGIEFYKEALSGIDEDFNERDIARKIGVMQGLEALLTYDPVIDKTTGEVVDV